MPFIRTHITNGVGEVILDRPKALNALDQTMVDDLYAVLLDWADDDAIDSVLVTSASERAFCAGGDIRAIRDHALAGDTAAITRYFAGEYRLNQLIAEYPKAYISLIDGPALGGGLGISVHGEVRVVTERAVLATPETAIGFFPDIGATYFLPRLPSGVGMWLGLTGARVRGSQALAVGLATHLVPSAHIAAVGEQIRTGVPLVDVLAPFAEQRDDHPPLPVATIGEYFGDHNVSAIIGGLRGAVGDDWARETLDLLASASPSSLWVTARLLELGETDLLDACLERELHAAEKITLTNDFAEGVRAVLVDKDRSPIFIPASIDDVDPDEVTRIVGA